MGMNHEPPNSCPTADAAVRALKDLGSILDELIDMVEELRTANSNIRDWAHGEIRDLRGEIEDMEQDILELKERD